MITKQQMARIKRCIPSSIHQLEDALGSIVAALTIIVPEATHITHKYELVGASGDLSEMQATIFVSIYTSSSGITTSLPFPVNISHKRSSYTMHTDNVWVQLPNTVNAAMVIKTGEGEHEYTQYISTREQIIKFAEWLVTTFIKHKMPHDQRLVIDNLTALDVRMIFEYTQQIASDRCNITTGN